MNDYLHVRHGGGKVHLAQLRPVASDPGRPAVLTACNRPYFLPRDKDDITWQAYETDAAVTCKQCLTHY